MDRLADYFQPGATILSLITVFILWRVNKSISFSKNILVTLLSVFALLNFNGVAYHQKWFFYVPQLHKTLLPLSLLIGPLTYLYVKAVLSGQLKLKPTDLWLGLPAILYAISMTPYYFMNLHDKLDYLTMYYDQRSVRIKDDQGILPSFVFPVFRVIWTAYFLILSFGILSTFKIKASQKLLQNNKDLLVWLSSTNVIVSVLLIVAVIGTITGPTLGSLFNLYDISLGLVVIVLCANLLSNPKILYGIHAPFPDESENNYEGPVDEKDNSTSEYAILATDAIRYRKVLQDYFHGSHHYLSADFSLQSLSTDTEIPKYVLSQFINREFGIGFREYLNHYRIQYMIDHFNQPQWKNYTLEAKSRECGFNSRKTFIDHFKKQTGKLPKTYFNS